MNGPERVLPPLRVTTTVRQAAGVAAAVAGRVAAKQQQGEALAPRRRVVESGATARPAPVAAPLSGVGSQRMTLGELVSLLDKQRRGQIVDSTDLDEDDTVSDTPIVLQTSQASFAARMLHRR